MIEYPGNLHDDYEKYGLYLEELLIGNLASQREKTLIERALRFSLAASHLSLLGEYPSPEYHERIHQLLKLVHVEKPLVVEDQKDNSQQTL